MSLQLPLAEVNCIANTTIGVFFSLFWLFFLYTQDDQTVECNRFKCYLLLLRATHSKGKGNLVFTELKVDVNCSTKGKFRNSYQWWTMLFTLFQQRCDVFDTNNATTVAFLLPSIYGFSYLQDEAYWKLYFCKLHQKHDGTCTQIINTKTIFDDSYSYTDCHVWWTRSCV